VKPEQKGTKNERHAARTFRKSHLGDHPGKRGTREITDPANALGYWPSDFANPS
jgi:hypothetical protein